MEGPKALPVLQWEKALAIELFVGQATLGEHTHRVGGRGVVRDGGAAEGEFVLGWLPRRRFRSALAGDGRGLGCEGSDALAVAVDAVAVVAVDRLAHVDAVGVAGVYGVAVAQG